MIDSYFSRIISTFCLAGATMLLQAQTDEINAIKNNYYPELNVTINQDNNGITFYKSKPVIESNDTHYMLVTSSL